MSDDWPRLIALVFVIVLFAAGLGMVAGAWRQEKREG